VQQVLSYGKINDQINNTLACTLDFDNQKENYGMSDGKIKRPRWHSIYFLTTQTHLEPIWAGYLTFLCDVWW